MAVGVEERDDRLTASARTIGFRDEPAVASVKAARLAIVDGCLGTQAISEAARPSVRAESAVRVAGSYGPEPQGLIFLSPASTPVAWPTTEREWSLDLPVGQLARRLSVEGGDDGGGGPNRIEILVGWVADARAAE